MAKLPYDLVSPERKLASGEADAIQIPGAEGDLTAMPDHAPLITTLRPGVLEVITPAGSTTYVVTGGFAEVTGEGTTVLAERAHPVEEVTQAMVDEMIAEAHEAHKAAHPDVADVTAKLLSDMVAMSGHIGLDANVPNF